MDVELLETSGPLETSGRDPTDGTSQRICSKLTKLRQTLNGKPLKTDISLGATVDYLLDTRSATQAKIRGMRRLIESYSSYRCNYAPIHSLSVSSIRSLAFYNYYLLVATSNQLLLYDMETGKTVALLENHPAAITCMSLSSVHDILVGYEDGTIASVSYQQDWQIQYTQTHSTPILFIKSLPNSSKMLSISQEFGVKVHDFGESVVFWSGNIDCLGVLAVCVEPTGRYFGVSYTVLRAEARVRVCFVEDGSPQGELVCEGFRVEGMEVRQRDGLLIAACSDEKLRIFGFLNGDLITCIKLCAPGLDSRRPFSLTLSREGDLALLSYGGGAIDVVDLNEESIYQRFKGKDAGIVQSAIISADGNTVISGSENGLVEFWNLELTCSQEEAILNTNSKITTLKFLPGVGRKFVSGHNTGELTFWDLDTRTQMGAVVDPKLVTILNMVVTSDSKIITSDGGILMGFHATGAKIFEIPHNAGIFKLEVSPDGKTLFIVTSAPSVINLMSIDQLTVKHTYDGHSLSISDLAVTNDGKFLLTASEDRTVKAWNLGFRAKEPEFVLEHDSWVTAVVATPNNRRILSGHNGGAITVWNIKHRCPEYSFSGHKGNISSLRVLSDGTKLISGSVDNTLRVWNLECRLLETTLQGHQADIKCFEISSDDGQIVSGTEDTTIRVWDLEIPSSTEIRRFTMKLDNGEVASEFDHRFFSLNAVHLAAFLENDVLIREVMKEKRVLPLLCDKSTGLNPIEVLDSIQNLSLLRKTLEYSQSLPLHSIEQVTRTFLALFSHNPEMIAVSKALNYRCQVLIESPEKLHGFPVNANMICSSEVAFQNLKHVKHLKEYFSNTSDSAHKNFQDLTFELITDNYEQTISSYIDVTLCDLSEFNSRECKFFETVARCFPGTSYPIYNTKTLSLLLEYEWNSLKKYHNRFFSFLLIFAFIFGIYTLGFYEYEHHRNYSHQNIQLDTVVLVFLLLFMVIFNFIGFLQWKNNTLSGYVKSVRNICDSIFNVSRKPAEKVISELFAR
mmetsp:Transcript_61811/g.70910  ORF Transcript_61811/g.70910 Transcript_61811/m.70910 type:complete len:1020 (+) Transcript_61811:183-3242(+)